MLAGIAGGLFGLALVLVLLNAPQPDRDAAATLARVGAAHAGDGTGYAFDLSGEVTLRLPPDVASPGRERLRAELRRLGAGAAEASAEGRELAVELRARGEVDADGAAAYELRWEVAGPVEASGLLDVRRFDDGGWVRPGEAPRWVTREDAGVFDLGVVSLPHGPVEVLSRLGDLEAAGDFGTERLDGRAVRHLRGRTAAGLVVDAWVDGDERLHRLAWLPPAPDDERDGTTHGQLTVRLRDHGLEEAHERPDDAVAPDELPEAARPPFG